MSLLLFSYCLAAFLFFYSYYLDSRSEMTTSLFTTMTMTAAFVSLFSAVSANLLYTGNVTISNLFFRLALVCLAAVIVSLLHYSFSVPYYARNVFLSIVSWIFILFAAYLLFSSGVKISWTAEGGFALSSRLVFGSWSALKVYAILYLAGLPALTLLFLIIRGFGLRSRIYRQRLFLIALSVTVGTAVSWGLFWLSGTYPWTLPLVPYGIAILLVLIHRTVSITTLMDRPRFVAFLLDFTVLSLLFSLSGALATACIIQFVPSLPAVIASLVFLVILMFFLRTRVAKRLHRYVRVGTEYEEDLEAGLDSIDFTSGTDEVLAKTVSLLGQYVECSSVDILVSDDKGKLVTIHSTTGAKNELPIESKGIDFLLNHNESIVLKTQAITHHDFAEVKGDLLKILDIGKSDAFILLREGHRVVGIILLGAKKRGSDYTDYDYTVLSNLYSNFFLVMYYLKNIAQESVVMTVDREIEFSGQIISSIQDNIDRINHPKVDVDFITRSARKLGGDFIDFIKLGEDKYLFVMGDVSGKGLNASMSMVILKSVLRTFLTETTEFKKLVVKVNLFIKNNLPKGTFFAGVFGMIDFDTNILYYLNCGVPAMFLYTAAYNNAIEIQGDGKVLGFVRDIGKYLKVKKIVLNPQDIILLTTDGLVDSTNLRGERFGKDRVQRMLMDNRTYPAGRMAQFLCDSLSDFVSRELEDDITVLVFKYLSK
jgi:Serine phosphatase RsbU, regulator of sigma subunit